MFCTLIKRGFLTNQSKIVQGPIYIINVNKIMIIVQWLTFGIYWIATEALKINVQLQDQINSKHSAFVHNLQYPFFSQTMEEISTLENDIKGIKEAIDAKNAPMKVCNLNLL